MNAAFAVHKYENGDGVVRLAVSGEIDNDLSDALSTIIINSAEQDGTADLVIDLQRVSFLSAAGISALLSGRAAALARGRGFSVVNARGIVRHALLAVGLERVLNLTTTTAPAARRSPALR